MPSDDNLLGILGSNISGTRTRSPFGSLPFGLAGNLGNQIQGLESLFGFGPANPRQARRQSNLLGRGGPLASAASGVQGLAPNVIPEATAAGQRVSAAGSQAFTTLQGQVAQALGAANTFGREAFDPALETPFYREAFRRGVEPARAGAAARGLLESGPGQQAEDDLARQLTTGFAQQQLGMQSQVPGLLVGPAQALQAGVSPFGQALESQYNMPLGAAGNLLQLLTSPQGSAQQLLGTTAPVQAPFSGKAGWGNTKTG